MHLILITAYEAQSITIPILRLIKLSHREIKEFVPDHKVSNVSFRTKTSDN